MAERRCIVRAYADEPLDRVAVAFERKTVFVVSHTAVERGDSAGAIGFPEANVFDFDSALMDELLTSYLLANDDLATLWLKAKPLQADLPLLERTW